MAEIQSAVRLPTPPIGGLREESSSPNPRKRKSPPSRSPSPRRRNGYRHGDRSRSRGPESRRTRRPSPPSPKVLTDAEKQEIARKEYQTLLEKSRSGGIYVPPARLRALQAALPEDKNSEEFQRQSWDALKKSINGLINKANTANLQQIVPELFQENLVRGRGLFCNSILRAQQSSQPYSAMFACLSAVVVSKVPQVGQLLIDRLASRFQKAFKRNEKAIALGSIHFIAHLTNQLVVGENLVMQMLLLLLANPTDDSVELAVVLTREVGAFLEEKNRALSDLVFEQMRNVLQSSDISQRTMFAVEVLMQQRKDRFKDNPIIPDELDLISDEDKYTLQPPQLDQPIDTSNLLNVFRVDPDFEENEKKWAEVKAQILGEDSDEEEEDDSDSVSEAEESETERQQDIKDLTADELTRLRRTIYLTLQSTSTFEEACHKLMKVQLPAGRERELPSMIIETCSQRPTYEKFYGLIGERLCHLSRFLQSLFEEEFADRFTTIHRYESNRLRSIASFFAHLIGTGALGFHILSCITMTEQASTSASRIFVKILLQGMVEELGLPKLNEKLRDPLLQPNLAGFFPTDHPRNTRFAINYYTSIGMGEITESMREHLQNMPAPAVPALPAAPARDRSASVSSRSSYSSYSSYSSRSRSDSRTPSRSRSPPRRRGRSVTRSRSRSRSYTPSRSRDRSLTPPRRSDARSARRSPSRSLSRSPSRTPPRRRRPRSMSSSRSRSRSPPPRRRSRSLSSRSRSPPPRRTAHRSPSMSMSMSMSRSRSRTPPRRHGARDRSRSRSLSSSRSPPPRRRGASPRSRSPPPRRRGGSPRSRSPSDTRSPYRNRSPPPRAAPPPRRSPPRRAPPPKPRERSLSPFSKRVALTRGQGGPGLR